MLLFSEQEKKMKKCSCRDYVPNLQCPQERSIEDLV
jgi:hypothetical protein